MFYGFCGRVLVYVSASDDVGLGEGEWGFSEE
jgi:hypothetical protein